MAATACFFDFLSLSQTWRSVKGPCWRVVAWATSRRYSAGLRGGPRDCCAQVHKAVWGELPLVALCLWYPRDVWGQVPRGGCAQASRSRATMAMMRMSVRSAVIHHMFAPPRRVVGLMREGCKLPPGAIRLNHPAQFGTIRLHQKTQCFTNFNLPAQFGVTTRRNSA